MKASVRRLSAQGIALMFLAACASNSPSPVEPTAEAPAPRVVAAPPRPKATASAATPPAPPPPPEEPAPAVPSDPVELFTAISKMRPFNSQYIAFEGIANFVNYYAAFSGNPDIAKAAASVRRNIRNYNDRVSMPTGIIQLHNLTTGMFKGMAKDPSAAYIMAGALYDIVHTSGALYQQFIVAQESRLSPDDLRGMQQQVTPGGPELTNIDGLNRLRYSLKQEWNQK